jgi:hypothetical protein
MNILALIKHVVEHNGLQIDESFKTDLDKGLKDAETVATDVEDDVKTVGADAKTLGGDMEKEVQENS